MLHEIKAKVFLCLLFTAVATACIGQSCGQSVVPPGVVNGVDVTVSSSGSVSTYSGSFTSCTTTTPPNSVYLGQMGSFSYTMNFSEQVNDIVVFITATGSGLNENFIFTTNSGIPEISVVATCFSVVNGNEILSGENSGIMGGGGEFIISAPSAYTSVTITGSGGENGALLSICSNSVLPAVCLANDQVPSLSAANLSTGCVASTANLSSLIASNIPAGTDLSWHTAVPVSDANRLQNTIVGPGTYYAAFHDAVNNCYGPEKTISVTQPLGEISAGQDLEICQGESIILTGSGGSNYVWSNNIQNGVSFIPSESALYTLNGLDTNNCPHSDELFVIVNPLPTVYAGADVNICPGTQVTLVASGALVYSWEKQIQNGVSFSPLESDDYLVTGIDVNGCQDTDEVNVTVLPQPLALFDPGTEQITELSPNVSLSNSSEGAVSYNWNFGDLSPFSTEHEPGHTYDQPGNFEITLIVTNDFGCTDTAVRVIEITAVPLYYIPNSFTPNGDAHNNVFSPVFNESFVPGDYELFVYNRWGELLFESHDPETGWDGTYANQSVMKGVYTWVMGFRSPENDKFIRKNGSINLIK
ncbi:MAG: hypothetical protein K0R65_724 [Crocinitomicaceae bacterium]|jgi:gliding motility-associated-like protein|nr:hypothetical protein [Crocinitomicaceae bacterium]